MNDKNSPRPTILIVDDTPDNIMLLSRLLKDKYQTKVATNGITALQIANATPGLDLILLDVMMPGVDGYETCRQLKAEPKTAGIPVIFLTAKSQVEDEAMGLTLGAVDYLTKPISPPILFARVATQLTLAGARRQLQQHNENLERIVAERTAQLSEMQDAAVMAIASTAQAGDNETANRIGRTRNYLRALAERLRNHPRFAAELSDETIELLYKSVPLHDIGKASIAERILLRPGPDDNAGCLQFARQIARSHQEKWDGSGYPDRLAGDAIALAARLMAVAEVYDALISPRLYRPPFTHQEALGIMAKGRASHFDPDILDAFLDIGQRVASIAAENRGPDHHEPATRAD